VSESPASRVFCSHQTVLFVDSGSGELRNGSNAGSPANVRLHANGAQGRLIFTADGTNRPIVCDAEGSRVADDQGSATVFEIVPLEGQWIALKAHGRYLCAIPGGAVRLSATICNAWENFLLADPPPRGPGYPEPRAARSLSISCIETRDGVHLARAARAVERTAACIRTDHVYWFSNLPFPGALPDIEVIHIKIPPFTDFIDDINRTCLHLMPQVVQSDFNLIVQDHAFAVNPQAWDPLFWEYDYIGSPFCGLWGGGPYWRGPIVGNGGFSLRSRKLNDALRAVRFNWRVEDWLSHDERVAQFAYYTTNAKGERCLPEDVVFSVFARNILERDYGVKFCPPELAAKFSLFESHPLTQFWVGRSFGFHGEGIAPAYGVSFA
jgi:hypothetical protein